MSSDKWGFKRLRYRPQLDVLSRESFIPFGVVEIIEEFIGVFAHDPSTFNSTCPSTTLLGFPGIGFIMASIRGHKIFIGRKSQGRWSERGELTFGDVLWEIGVMPDGTYAWLAADEEVYLEIGFDHLPTTSNIH